MSAMGMVRATLVMVVVVFASRRAEACSCTRLPNDLMEQLNLAKTQADQIFYARVVSIEGVTTLDVIENFKGKAKGRVTLPEEDGCAFRFEVGGKYLVYAYGFRTSLCTRTRRLENAKDAELKWLRTGKPPVVPVILQREEVTCTRCSIETLAEELAGPNEKKQGMELEAKRPFWSGGRNNEGDPTWTDMVVVAKDGRAFRLLRTSENPARSCRHRITLTYCEALKPAGRSKGLPQFECVKPGEAKVLCDEPATRTTKTLPAESLEFVRSCNWRDVEQPYCELSSANGHLGLEGPTLFCSPAYDPFDRNPNRYACTVRPK